MNRKAAHMINVALKAIEMDYHLVHVLDECTSQKQVNSIMIPLKERIKERRRVLAKKYHPDVNNGGGEKMKRINEACDFLLKLKVNWKPRPPQAFHGPVFYFHFNSRGGIWSPNETTTTTSYF